MPNNEFDWTEDAVSRLRYLRTCAELSDAEIGRRIGVSKNAVTKKAHRMGIPPRPSRIKPSTRRPQTVKRVPAGASTLPPLASLAL